MKTTVKLVQEFNIALTEDEVVLLLNILDDINYSSTKEELIEFARGLKVQIKDNIVARSA